MIKILVSKLDNLRSKLLSAEKINSSPRVGMIDPPINNSSFCDLKLVLDTKSIIKMLAGINVKK